MSIAIDSNLLTTGEVAQLLGISVGRVRQFVVEKRLVADRKIGVNLLFDPEVVAVFAREPRLTGRPRKSLRADS